MTTTTTITTEKAKITFLAKRADCTRAAAAGYLLGAEVRGRNLNERLRVAKAELDRVLATQPAAPPPAVSPARAGEP